MAQSRPKCYIRSFRMLKSAVVGPGIIRDAVMTFKFGLIGNALRVGVGSGVGFALLLCVTIFAGFGSAGAVQAAEKGASEIDLSQVGQVALENSGNAGAQEGFLKGLAQLHNFQYDASAEYFRAAQQADPGFALAYWGEAMTYTHPIWMEQDLTAARDALGRLAPTAKERIAKAGTALEQDLMRAVEILYGPGGKEKQDFLYSDFMGTLYEKYPSHPEVGSFYALSIMGTAHFGREFDTYMRAAAVAQSLIHEFPGHPGLAHYQIHATDDPIHAPLGLAAARAYSVIAPKAAHAQHMTSHIFLALGLWDDVITANENAVGLVNAERAAGGRPTIGCGHYPSWLEYGYLQAGRAGDAEAIMERCHQIATEESPDSPRAVGSFLYMKTLYLMDTEDWDGAVAKMQVDASISAYARFSNDYLNAYGALARGEIDAAAEHFAAAGESAAAVIAEMDADGMAADNPERSYSALQLLQLEGLLTLGTGGAGGAGGNSVDAVALLEKAVEMELGLPHGFGPPWPAKPSLELLGEVLMGLGEDTRAREVLERALARTPNRTRLLRVLERGKVASGQ